MVSLWGVVKGKEKMTPKMFRKLWSNLVVADRNEDTILGRTSFTYEDKTTV